LRSLIYVPVVHTEMDMGSLAEGLQALYCARYGAAKWEEHIRTIREMWRGIGERINALQIGFRRMKLYQDGLPVCGKEELIVRELALQGSLNHQLLGQLMDRGAKLVGTESPELLLREYYLVKSQLARGAIEGAPQAGRIGAPTSRRTPGSAAQIARTTLRERDRFIARRIEETLAEDETGILFMGFAHNVHRCLSGSIKVQFLIHRLPFGKDLSLRAKRNGLCGDEVGQASSLSGRQLAGPTKGVQHGFG